MKFIRVIALVNIFFCALSAFQCNSSVTEKKEVKKNNENSNLNPYFPIKEGNSWKYVNEAPREETELFVVTASDIKKVEGGIQAGMSSFPFLTKDNEPRSIKVKENGEIEIYDYMGNSGVFFPAEGQFKKGGSWTFGIFNARITGCSEKITTEDGEYSDCCYVMMTDGFTFSFEMWFKKDIGIVKWGANRTNPPTLKAVYYVLKDHKLN